MEALLRQRLTLYYNCTRNSLNKIIKTNDMDLRMRQASREQLIKQLQEQLTLLPLPLALLDSLLDAMQAAHTDVEDLLLAGQCIESCDSCTARHFSHNLPRKFSYISQAYCMQASKSSPMPMVKPSIFATAELRWNADLRDLRHIIKDLNEEVSSLRSGQVVGRLSAQKKELEQQVSSAQLN